MAEVNDAGKQTQKRVISRANPYMVYMGIKLALHIAILYLNPNLIEKNIRIQSDNTTTVLYINAMGGGGSSRSINCYDMALQAWQWPSSRNIWLRSMLPPRR